MNSSSQKIFRVLPSVSRLLETAEMAAAVARSGHEPVKRAIRSRLDELRKELAQDSESATAWIASADFLTEFCRQVEHTLSAQERPELQPVFNLTGTIIHTNLGRARLPQSALDAVARVGGEACNLEFDLGAGQRGDRDSHLEALICELTGAEAATVVNNNAAAVLLVANSLAADREVLISRGELVEIGGSFRIPDVMRSAHCELREVGTTNRTHLKDYRAALGPRSGLIMKVHTSNYEIKGFTAEVDERELADLAREHGLAFVSDLGSGNLMDLRKFGLPHEPTVMEAFESGADLVTFSGDKLLGGPQAGIIAGRRDLVTRVKQNPLKRALRVDKLCIAALIEVLSLYRDPERARREVPFLRDLSRPLSDIKTSAVTVAAALDQALGSRVTVTHGPCQSQIGSGALPLDLLDSVAIYLTPETERGETDARLQALARAFRELPKPVVGRINDGRLIFDLRCLQDAESFIEQLQALDIPQ